MWYSNLLYWELLRQFFFSVLGPLPLRILPQNEFVCVSVTVIVQRSRLSFCGRLWNRKMFPECRSWRKKVGKISIWRGWEKGQTEKAVIGIISVKYYVLIVIIFLFNHYYLESWWIIWQFSFSIKNLHAFENYIPSSLCIPHV